MNLYRKYLIIILILNLCGCYKPSIPQSNFAPITIKNINNYLLKARIQVMLNYPNKHNVFLGSIDWKKYSDHTLINLRSYFNIKNLIIKQHNNPPYNIEILADQSSLQLEASSKLEKLIKSKVINLNNLNYWLFGIPISNKKYNLTSDGFIQEDWLITYKDFKKVNFNNQNILIPSKTSLKYLKNTGYKLEIKIMFQNLTSI